jgi:hypothetical protein
MAIFNSFLHVYQRVIPSKEAKLMVNSEEGALS